MLHKVCSCSSHDACAVGYTMRCAMHVRQQIYIFHSLLPYRIKERLHLVSRPAVRLQVVLRMSKELPLVVQYRIVDMGEIKYASLPPRQGPTADSPALLCNSAQSPIAVFSNLLKCICSL